MRHPSWPYTAPFAAYVILLALEQCLALDSATWYPVRMAVSSAALVVFSRRVARFSVSRPVGSVLTGVLIFFIWIGPDLLWPGYRDHWLFQNAVTGAVQGSIGEYTQTDRLFLTFRLTGSIILVPIIEELFWRAWLMRYLISRDFERVALGSYAAQAFWITALLFASEHGPYWDVGLLAGIGYNWWMVRTRSLGDCILAHAATNGCLAAYVLAAGQWKYWL